MLRRSCLAPCQQGLSIRRLRRGTLATLPRPPQIHPVVGPRRARARPMAQRAEDGGNEAGVDADAGATLEQAPAQGQPQPQPSTLSDRQDVFSRVFDVFSYARHRAGRLKELQRQVDADPDDVGKEAAFMSELGKHDPAAVIKRFEEGQRPTNADCVVAYLRAMVNTGNIAKYQSSATLESPQSLNVLLTNLAKRSDGSALWFLASMAALSMLCVMGASAARGYLGRGGLPTGAVAVGSSSQAASSAHNPKEYSKENIPEKSVKTFADIKGCDEAKAELEEIVEYLKNPAKFTRLGGKLPKGVLLAGPPGTGKTLLARAVAGEAGVPFFFRAGSEFEEMFVGVGSRRVRSLFAAAKKKTPCIVFIDEIDAIGASRKSWESHTRKTLNQLLVEMDGFESNEGIIVLAATNLPETLDAALTRPGRFDRHITVSNPDVKGRQQIIELYLQGKPVDKSVNTNLLARSTPGFSGADLSNLINVAAIQAAMNNLDEINSALLDAAKDRILMGAERKSVVVSEESRKLTAYHEGGHAIVALNTAGAHPIHKATITPRGNSLGMVTQVPSSDETSVSRRQMLARLDVCMGGRVAEELIFGPDQVTSGATSDLQQATNLARYMVKNCGMSELVGPIYLSETSSPDTEHKVELEVTRLLREAYERVTQLLQAKEAELHKLASALLAHETLNAKEINDAISTVVRTTSR